MCSMKRIKPIKLTRNENIKEEWVDDIQTIELVVKNKIYTPYQVTIWHLKTAESFSAKPYPDGKYNSIAFGYNFVHGKVGNQTWESGTQLLVKTVKGIQDRLTKRFPEMDCWQIAALTCRFYNRGEGSLPKFKEDYLQGCCGSHYSCGFTCRDKKKQNNIRTAHNARRKFEYNLFKKNWGFLKIEELQQRCTKLQQKHS